MAILEAIKNSDPISIFFLCLIAIGFIGWSIEIFGGSGHHQVPSQMSPEDARAYLHWCQVAHPTHTPRVEVIAIPPSDPDAHWMMNYDIGILRKQADECRKYNISVPEFLN